MASLSEVRRRALHSLIPPPPALTTRHDFPRGRHSSCVASSDALEPEQIKRLRELVAAGASSVNIGAELGLSGNAVRVGPELPEVAEPTKAVRICGVGQ